MKLTSTIMIPIISAQPSNSSPYFPMIRETLFVTPIAPSPMTIRVNKLIRSIKCVFLKLSILQNEDMPMTAIDSSSMTTYHTMYTPR